MDKIIMTELSSLNRSKNINKQIVFSFVLKFIAMALGFLIIPKTLHILGNDQYGIWLTILSIVSWLVSFDVGIGNGLRNKLTESLAVNDYELACKYISTGYFALAAIGGFIILTVSIIMPFINWNEVFNTKLISDLVLSKTMYIITIAVIINFVVIIVNQVMNAFQLTAYTNVVSILHSAFFLFMLKYMSNIEDLYSITKAYSLCLVISGLLVSALFYYNRREYIPRLKWIDISKVHDILKLGGSFFIIQIATIIMFSISNIMIIQLLSPNDVSVYNVIFRLFSILTLTFSIIITPYWSAFTEANKKGDFKWIKKSIFNLHILLGLSILGAVILIIFHQIILDLWLGKDKIVPGYMLSIIIAVYSVVLNWSNIYSHFLNGIGILRMQTIVAVIQAVLVIPSCLFFTNVLKLGLVGVVLSMVVCMLPFAILGPVVTYKKLNSFKNEE